MKVTLRGRYLEVKRDKRKDKGFQILHKVVKDAKTFGIVRFGDVD